MSFDMAEDVQAIAGKRRANQCLAHLSGNYVVEFNCDHRRDLIIWIRIVGICTAECRSGQEQHQTENYAAKITMSYQKCSLALTAAHWAPGGKPNQWNTNRTSALVKHPAAIRRYLAEALASELPVRALTSVQSS
jgi:hypothetical protein